MSLREYCHIIQSKQSHALQREVWRETGPRSVWEGGSWKVNNATTLFASNQLIGLMGWTGWCCESGEGKKPDWTVDKQNWTWKNDWSQALPGLIIWYANDPWFGCFALFFRSATAPKASSCELVNNYLSTGFWSQKPSTCALIRTNPFKVPARGPYFVGRNVSALSARTECVIAHRVSSLLPFACHTVWREAVSVCFRESGGGCALAYDGRVSKGRFFF